MVPPDKNWFWFIKNVSFTSRCITPNTWCNASPNVEATETVDLNAENVFLLNLPIVVIPTAVSCFDSTSWVRSLPFACPDAKNLYDPVPSVVELNPMILDLTLTSFDPEFVKFNDNTPVSYTHLTLPTSG